MKTDLECKARIRQAKTAQSVLDLSSQLGWRELEELRTHCFKIRVNPSTRADLVSMVQKTMVARILEDPLAPEIEKRNARMFASFIKADISKAVNRAPQPSDRRPMLVYPDRVVKFVGKSFTPKIKRFRRG